MHESQLEGRRQGISRFFASLDCIFDDSGMHCFNQGSQAVTRLKRRARMIVILIEVRKCAAHMYLKKFLRWRLAYP